MYNILNIPSVNLNSYYYLQPTLFIPDSVDLFNISIELETRSFLFARGTEYEGHSVNITFRAQNYCIQAYSLNNGGAPSFSTVLAVHSFFFEIPHSLGRPLLTSTISSSLGVYADSYFTISLNHVSGSSQSLFLSRSAI